MKQQTKIWIRINAKDQWNKELGLYKSKLDKPLAHVAKKGRKFKLTKWEAKMEVLPEILQKLKKIIKNCNRYRFVNYIF